MLKSRPLSGMVCFFFILNKKIINKEGNMAVQMAAAIAA